MAFDAPSPGSNEFDPNKRPGDDREPTAVEVASEVAPRKSDAPAWWAAGAALVLAGGLEIALTRQLSTLDVIAICHGSGGGVGVDTLMVGVSAVLLLGGVLSLALTLVRRPRGSPGRGRAIIPAVVEMILAPTLLFFNFFLIFAATFGCDG